jgi:hypothetical protein
LATVIAEAGPITRYPTASRSSPTSAGAGLIPRAGGYKDSHPRLSQAGSRFVRRIVCMLAIDVIRRPGPHQDDIAQRTAAGTHKRDSVRSRTWARTSSRVFAASSQRTALT